MKIIALCALLVSSLTHDIFCGASISFKKHYDKTIEYLLGELEESFYDMQDISWAFWIVSAAWAFPDKKVRRCSLEKIEVFFNHDMQDPRLAPWIAYATWVFPDEGDVLCSDEVAKKRDDATGNGALGKAYRLLDEGDVEEAAMLLNQNCSINGQSMPLKDAYPALAQAVANKLQEHACERIKHLQDEHLKAKADRLECSKTRLAEPVTFECLDPKGNVVRFAPLQIQFLKEGHAILAGVSAIKYDLFYDARFDLLADATQDCVQVAIKLTKEGEMMQAVRILDASWSLFHCLEMGMDLVFLCNCFMNTRVGLSVVSGDDYLLEITDIFINLVLKSIKEVTMLLLEGKKRSDIMEMAAITGDYRLVDVERLVKMCEYIDSSIYMVNRVWMNGTKQGTVAASLTGALLLRGMSNFCRFVKNNALSLVTPILSNMR